jgi:thiol-disulfide isomerase/thioredoxin
MKKLKISFLIFFIFTFSYSFGQEKIILRNQEQYHKIASDQYTKKDDKLLLNTEAANFKFRTIKGDSIQLSELRGKVVLMTVFHTLCGQCYNEMPFINNLVEEYKNTGVIFLAITPHDARATIFRKQEKMEQRGKVGIYHDDVRVIPASYLGEIGDSFRSKEIQKLHGFENVTEKFLEKEYPVLGAPINYFIDKKGIIRFISYGYVPKKYDYYPLYTNEIDKLLAEKYKKN